MKRVNVHNLILLSREIAKRKEQFTLSFFMNLELVNFLDHILLSNFSWNHFYKRGLSSINLIFMKLDLNAGWKLPQGPQHPQKSELEEEEEIYSYVQFIQMHNLRTNKIHLWLKIRLCSHIHESGYHSLKCFSSCVTRSCRKVFLECPFGKIPWMSNFLNQNKIKELKIKTKIFLSLLQLHSCIVPVIRLYRYIITFRH